VELKRHDVNAAAPRNGTLRNESVLLFSHAPLPVSRARAVVGGRVFAVRACLLCTLLVMFFLIASVPTLLPADKSEATIGYSDVSNTPHMWLIQNSHSATHRRRLKSCFYFWYTSPTSIASFDPHEGQLRALLLPGHWQQ